MSNSFVRAFSFGLDDEIRNLGQLALGSADQQFPTAPPMQPQAPAPNPFAQQPAMAPIPTPRGEEMWPQVQAGIFKGESGGDYDALFNFQNREGGKFAGTKLTNMTVDEAIAFSDPKGPYANYVKGQVGRIATPMGAYQFVGKTLRGLKEQLGLKGNERMTPELQDRLGKHLWKTAGTGQWEGYKGPADPSSMSSRNSPYGGDDSDIEELEAELKQDPKVARRQYWGAALKDLSTGIGDVGRGKTPDMGRFMEAYYERQEEAKRRLGELALERRRRVERVEGHGWDIDAEEREETRDLASEERADIRTRASEGRAEVRQINAELRAEGFGTRAEDRAYTRLMETEIRANDRTLSAEERQEARDQAAEIREDGFGIKAENRGYKRLIETETRANDRNLSAEERQAARDKAAEMRAEVFAIAAEGRAEGAQIRTEGRNLKTIEAERKRLSEVGKSAIKLLYPDSPFSETASAVADIDPAIAMQFAEAEQAKIDTVDEENRLKETRQPLADMLAKSGHEDLAQQALDDPNAAMTNFEKRTGPSDAMKEAAVLLDPTDPAAQALTKRLKLENYAGDPRLEASAISQDKLLLEAEQRVNDSRALDRQLQLASELAMDTPQGFKEKIMLLPDQILDSLGLQRDGLQQKELFDAMAKRSTAGVLAAENKGAASDRDTIFFQQSLPQLGNTREGNIAISYANRELNRREKVYVDAWRTFYNTAPGEDWADSTKRDAFIQSKLEAANATGDIMPRVASVEGALALPRGTPFIIVGDDESQLLAIAE